MLGRQTFTLAHKIILPYRFTDIYTLIYTLYVYTNRIGIVMDLNSRREFNYYRKTIIVFIIEELWAWLKVTSFTLITGSSLLWSFYASETGNASGTNKIVQAQKWSKRGTEHADCTKDGLVLPVMLFVNPLFSGIICENI